MFGSFNHNDVNLLSTDHNANLVFSRQAFGEEKTQCNLVNTALLLRDVANKFYDEKTQCNPANTALLLGNLANGFHKDFKSKMCGLNYSLSKLLQNENLMKLLENERREKFKNAVYDFNRTYNVLNNMNLMHGSTNIAQYEEIKEKVISIIESIGGTESNIWKCYCMGLESIKLKLEKIIDLLSFFKA